MDAVGGLLESPKGGSSRKQEQREAGKQACVLGRDPEVRGQWEGLRRLLGTVWSGCHALFTL